MATISRIIRLIADFIRNYFWGIVTGACWTTAFAAAWKLGDDLGNMGTFLQTQTIKDVLYHLLSALHTVITVYWNVMGEADIIILILSIALLVIKALT